MSSFSFQCYGVPRDLSSFPTRRSSDLTRVLLRLIESPLELRCAVQVVGAEPTTLAEFLRSLRASLGLRPTRTLTIPRPDRKSTRLNSSHGYISYAVFCLKKKRSGRQPH